MSLPAGARYRSQSRLRPVPCVPDAVTAESCAGGSLLLTAWSQFSRQSKCRQHRLHELGRGRSAAVLCPGRDSVRPQQDGLASHFFLQVLQATWWKFPGEFVKGYIISKYSVAAATEETSGRMGPIMVKSVFLFSSVKGIKGDSHCG